MCNIFFFLNRNELSPLTLAKRLADQNLSSVAGSSELDPLGLQVVRLSRCSHINRPLGTFHPHDFKKVMAYILLGEEPKYVYIRKRVSQKSFY